MAGHEEAVPAGGMILAGMDRSQVGTGRYIGTDTGRYYRRYRPAVPISK